MRNSNPFDDYILSTPLALAALIVYGPRAAVVFVAAGLAMTMALRMVWWRVLLNAALLGLQGLVTAGVLIAITPGYRLGGADDQRPDVGRHGRPGGGLRDVAMFCW